LLSIELIRKEQDFVKAAMHNRGENIVFTSMLEIDAKRRRYIVQRDALRSRRNEVSKKIGRMREKPQDLIEEMRQVGDEIKNLDDQTKAVQAELNSILLTIPNIPLDSVPKGTGESQNIVVREFGQLEQLTFEALPHWDLGERLDIIDFERGAKLSGSRFYILKGMGAKLERALISWMLDVHTKKHGYTEISPPYLVKQETMLASGNLPKFADNLYQDTEDDLWLIPTAEVPLTSLHRNEIIQSEKLPLYYTAYTPCFRREKASAGKDTRGIKRVHQFGKVEMYKFVEPTTSNMELEKLINDAEDICRMLSIPYRIIELCTGDLGFNAAKTYDLEMWAAGSQEWLEVSSCSNCTDFQARRANIKYRSSDQNKTQFVHTLNGSGLALPRVIIAILENYQQSDGSVLIPEVLRPYTGFDLIR
jgi:seryl-tRNA synthetase